MAQGTVAAATAMHLYSFFNSSTSYRVRIALALKGVGYETHGINIRNNAHRDPTFVATINPSACVPALVDGEGSEPFSLGQSLAIIDYLDERFPTPRLIPKEQPARARVLELSYLVACDIHPVNNTRVLRYLQEKLGHTAAEKDAWYQHWVAEGLAAVERLLVQHGSPPWCFGSAPTLADCCLVPQIANASRMGCDTAAYPTAMAVYRHAIEHPAFKAAAPDRQPDFAP